MLTLFLQNLVKVADDRTATNLRIAIINHTFNVCESMKSAIELLFRLVLCKGHKLNGAVSSPVPLRGALLSICCYPQNAGNLVHSPTQNWYSPQGMSPQTHMKSVKNEQQVYNFLHHGDRYRALQSGRAKRGDFLIKLRRSAPPEGANWSPIFENAQFCADGRGGNMEHINLYKREVDEFKNESKKDAEEGERNIDDAQKELAKECWPRLLL